MKTVLITLGAVALVAIVVCAGALFWAQSAGSELQEKFFRAATSGDPAQVLAIFHPRLREEVDEPVLAAWMKVVRSELGAFQGLSKTNFNTSARFEGGASIVESEGAVNFEKGSADSKLLFRDGQLVEFHIKSDRIPDDWFHGPEDTALYRTRGKEFLTHFLGGKTDAAFAAMHKSLQEAMPRDKLQSLIDEFQEKAGKLQTITEKEDGSDDKDGYRLIVNYAIRCEKTPLTAALKFGFVGLKGHLVGFDVHSEDAAGGEQKPARE